MRELRAEVLIPLLLQAAQRKKQAQAVRGEGDEAKHAGKKEAETARSEVWDVTARGEGAGEATREGRGERRNGLAGHGEQQGGVYGRGVSAARHGLWSLAPTSLSFPLFFFPPSSPSAPLPGIPSLLLHPPMPILAGNSQQLSQQCTRWEWGEVDLETGSHWPLISLEAKDLIRRMLDVDPNRRIGSSRQCSLTEVKASQSKRRGRFMIFSAPSSPVHVAHCMKNEGGVGGASRLSLLTKDGSVDQAMEDGVLGCSPNSVLD
ncbi:unnamed protein product, partial [Closterium sp. Naga37s-1]